MIEPQQQYRTQNLTLTDVVVTFINNFYHHFFSDLLNKKM